MSKKWPWFYRSKTISHEKLYSQHFRAPHSFECYYRVCFASREKLPQYTVFRSVRMTPGKLTAKCNTLSTDVLTRRGMPKHSHAWSNPSSAWMNHGQFNTTQLFPYILTVSRTFNPPFRVLFNFPSRYLFAIGLSVVFSFGWSLSPVRVTLSSNPTLQSNRSWLFRPDYGTITLYGSSFQKNSSGFKNRGN